ncbi:MAG TPA: adenylyltransferase/cytidyltransferase family protein, partial [Candidatus Acidoferrum sp.]|nr:adenylyltransferase/cytidyltransferase family protein [Candidatus Acidoferrum sp.]
MIRFGIGCHCSRSVGGPLGKVVSQADLLPIIAQTKRDGRRIVFTNGCFDILHPGHIRLLEAARDFGDMLIVAL